MFLFFLRIHNMFLNLKLVYDIHISFLFMAILLIFVKSIYIFNEMNYNLKCSTKDREFVLKGAFLTKNSRKIQHLFWSNKLHWGQTHGWAHVQYINILNPQLHLIFWILCQKKMYYLLIWYLFILFLNISYHKIEYYYLI